MSGAMLSQLPQFRLRRADAEWSTATTSQTTTSTRPNTSGERRIAADLTYASHERPPPNASSYFHNITRNSSLNLSKSSKHALQYRQRTSSINLVDKTEAADLRLDRSQTAVRSKSRPPIVLHQSYAEAPSDRRRSLSSRPRLNNPSLSDASEPITRTLDSHTLLSHTAGYTSHNDPDIVSRRPSISTRAYNSMMSTYGSGQIMYGSMSVGSSAPGSNVPGLASPTMETVSYQHIQEMCTKRISTLDYLRKAHEGRVYWFNTLLFTKADLSKSTYFESRKLARRATNFLLLGLSLPAVLDLNSNSALEYLRTLNALLSEFESFQTAHPPDGTGSTLSRARIPQMFKRTLGTTGSRSSRRTSGAADIGLPYSASEGTSEGMGNINHPTSSFPSSENDLLPGEEYTFLLTPSLPFDPDFYETFATLCDVLIDCYTNLMKLITGPSICGPTLAEAFTNADKKVRKIIVQGVVKEFEDASRNGAKSEIAGIGRVVLGGLA